MAALPAATRAQLGALVEAARRCLDGKLAGMILHGSAATSGFEATRSDLDVLVIASAPLTPADRAVLGETLLAVSGAPHPVELSVLTRAALQRWQHPCVHEFHFGEDHRQRYRTAGFEPDVSTDEDLAAHLTMARARGIDLMGGFPQEALPPVPRRDFLASLLSDFRWAARQGHALQDYRSANACRAWAYLESAALLSKSEGVRWCAEHHVDATDLVARVVERLRRELGEETGRARCGCDGC